MNKIEIKDFNFFYGKNRVIRNFNLNIEANKITSIFGPANSGTTTLLCCLNRFCDLNNEARYSGDILIDGKSIFAPKVSVTALRRRVGMVFEVPTPLPMSIFDNVSYGLRLLHVKRKQRIPEIVEMSLRQAALWDEVKNRLNFPAASLSGGQQQRMCIARILALEPDVLLIDRACSGLDPISTAKIEGSLMRLKKQMTIVISPHNIQQANRISECVVFMQKGEWVEKITDFRI
ncbi:MAG: phosphate ABC transporter ATP-binding protein [Oscillospiraceae bacterium]|nr:phosphate ABC transporter ATP-binding protein [Oscillospiraceae bacterium]